MCREEGPARLRAARDRRGAGRWIGRTRGRWCWSSTTTPTWRWSAACTWSVPVSALERAGTGQGRGGGRTAAVAGPGAAGPHAPGLRRRRGHPQAEVRPGHVTLPVVMLTARADERDQIAAWDVGVSDYLTKPFEGVEAGRHRHGGARARRARERLERREEAMHRLRGADAERQSRIAAIVEGAGDAVIGETVDGVDHLLEHRCGAALRVAGGGGGRLLDLGHRRPRQRGRARRHPPPGGRPGRRSTPTRRSGCAGTASGSTSRCGSRRSAASNGEVVGISSIARDVTERVQMEARFRSLVEAAPDAMVIVDPTGASSWSTGRPRCCSGTGVRTWSASRWRS